MRLPLWPDNDVTVSGCGQTVDAYGDHAFCCTSNTKTTMSNEIRDGLIRVLGRLLPTTGMISTASAVEKELRHVVKAMPTIRPFDLSIKLDHLLTDRAWRSPLCRLGFDVCVISSNASSSAKSLTACKHTSALRLRNSEWEKFCRRGHTNKDTKLTMTGNEIIGEILATNIALIPITVTDLGQFGSLFERFLYGTDAHKLPTFGKDRVHARKAALLARSTKVPLGILPHANKLWRLDHPGEFYGFSYKAMDPMTYAKQQLGLISSTAVANPILRTHQKIKSRPLTL